MRKKVSRFSAMALLVISAACLASFEAAATEFFELRTYYYTKAEQESGLDNFLQNALIPALHRQGIRKVGVFKPIANDTAAIKKIYVFIPHDNMKEFSRVAGKLEKDKVYQSAGSAYIHASYQSPMYQRMEVSLLEPFSHMRESRKPALKGAVSERVYELRSYESHTEKIHGNKVHMFNEGGEVALFERLGFNAIFYGHVVAGCTMPNLVYMTSFENMEERNAHWKTFGADPEWKKLSSLPEYQNNVSKNVTTLCRATAYSDL
jgi:hypothetical protein